LYGANDFFADVRDGKAYLSGPLQKAELTEQTISIRLGIPIENIEIENEPEWSLKNTLKRLIAYVFSFGFLAMAIAIWRNGGFRFSILLLIIFGSFYIVFDVYVMWSKRTNSSA